MNKLLSFYEPHLEDCHKIETQVLNDLFTLDNLESHTTVHELENDLRIKFEEALVTGEHAPEIIDFQQLLIPDLCTTEEQKQAVLIDKIDDLTECQDFKRYIEDQLESQCTEK